MISKNKIVATGGPLGASSALTSYEIDSWICPKCKANDNKRDRCIRCKFPRPIEESIKQVEKQEKRLSTSGDHGWREAIDPDTKQLYYFHITSGLTQWDRPKEMGDAPLATGWFGRGKAGAKEMYESKNREYLKRPAAKQAEALANHNVAYQEGANEFNIWYGKWIGDHWSDRKTKKEPAATRCNIEMHAGYTKADQENSDSSYFCIWFARGLCAKGASCTFFHRIPTLTDCGRLEKDIMHDCFGRERHGDHRDDMGGVGSFKDSCRTLYVGGLVKLPYEGEQKREHELEKVVEKHFSEWGEVERVNIIWRLSVAFVRFRLRSNAEFAKEAMANQCLDHNEIINIRWAHEDLNPVAIEAKKRADADAILAAVQASQSANTANSQLPIGSIPMLTYSSSTTNTSFSTTTRKDEKLSSKRDRDSDE